MTDPDDLADLFAEDGDESDALYMSAPATTDDRLSPALRQSVGGRILCFLTVPDLLRLSSSSPELRSTVFERHADTIWPHARAAAAVQLNAGAAAASVAGAGPVAAFDWVKLGQAARGSSRRFASLTPCEGSSQSECDADASAPAASGFTTQAMLESVSLTLDLKLSPFGAVGWRWLRGTLRTAFARVELSPAVLAVPRDPVQPIGASSHRELQPRLECFLPWPVHSSVRTAVGKLVQKDWTAVYSNVVLELRLHAYAAALQLRDCLAGQITVLQAAACGAGDSMRADDWGGGAAAHQLSGDTGGASAPSLASPGAVAAAAAYIIVRAVCLQCARYRAWAEVVESALGPLNLCVGDARDDGCCAAQHELPSIGTAALQSLRGWLLLAADLRAPLQLACGALRRWVQGHRPPRKRRHVEASAAPGGLAAAAGGASAGWLASASALGLDRDHELAVLIYADGVRTSGGSATGMDRAADLVYDATTASTPAFQEDPISARHKTLGKRLRQDLATEGRTGAGGLLSLPTADAPEGASGPHAAKRARMAVETPKGASSTWLDSEVGGGTQSAADRRVVVGAELSPCAAGYAFTTPAATRGCARPYDIYAGDWARPLRGQPGGHFDAHGDACLEAVIADVEVRNRRLAVEAAVLAERVMRHTDAQTGEEERAAVAAARELAASYDNSRSEPNPGVSLADHGWRSEHVSLHGRVLSGASAHDNRRVRSSLPRSGSTELALRQPVLGVSETAQGTQPITAASAAAAGLCSSTNTSCGAEAVHPRTFVLESFLQAYAADAAVMCDSPAACATCGGDDFAGAVKPPLPSAAFFAQQHRRIGAADSARVSPALAALQQLQSLCEELDVPDDAGSRCRPSRAKLRKLLTEPLGRALAAAALAHGCRQPRET
jgi:hypothetical protein